MSLDQTVWKLGYAFLLKVGSLQIRFNARGIVSSRDLYHGTSYVLDNNNNALGTVQQTLPDIQGCGKADLEI
jgi:hypothetical protein